jgi:hypothetical protein
MRNSLPHSYNRRLHVLRKRAFTIVEVTIASALTTMIMGSVLMLSTFALRSIHGVAAQLQLNSQSRIVNKMILEMKEANLVSIQNYNGTTITPITTGQPIQGNSMLLTLPNGTATYQVIYWVNNSGQLYRSPLVGGTSQLWLTNITSATPFSARDYTGTIVTIPNANMLYGIALSALDPNTRDFRQVLSLQVSVNNRN